MKIGLVIGLNAIDSTSFAYKGWAGELTNPVNDARSYASLYAQHGFTMTSLLNERAFGDAVRDGIKTMADDTKAGDSVVIAYGGHGARYGGFLTPYNETILLWDEQMTDSEFHSLLCRFKPGVRVIVEFDSCLVGSTRIPLLDGTEPTIKELSERGGTFWVYSATSDGEVVPGLAHSARLTRKAEVFRVHLDNAQYVECTGNHLFMLRDGTYKHAFDLRSGESLMPLYRRIGTAREGYLKGYELTRDLRGRGKWNATHTVVAKYCGIRPDRIAGFVVHHKNFNKRDNRPDNLQLMTWEAHKKMHGVVGAANLKKTWSNPEFRAWRKSEEYKAAQSERILKTWSDPEHHKLRSEINRKVFERDGFPVKFRAYNFSEANSKLTISRNKPGGDIYEAIHQRMKAERDRRARLDENDLPFENWNVSNPNNHTVVSVETSGVIEDVYDLTVDDHHNFAVASGVFVHNCHGGGMAVRGMGRSRAMPFALTKIIPEPEPRATRGIVEASVLFMAAARPDELASDGWGDNGDYTAARLRTRDEFTDEVPTFRQWFEATQLYMLREHPAQHPIALEMGQAGVFDSPIG